MIECPRCGQNEATHRYTTLKRKSLWSPPHVEAVKRPAKVCGLSKRRLKKLIKA